MEEIVNRVNQSGLTQIDLESLRIPGERVFFDIAPNLFMGLALKEKDFRAFLSAHEWSNYAGKHVAIGCEADAIIPMWAFMLVSTHLQPFAKTIVFGNLVDLDAKLFQDAINQIDLLELQDARVVIKGCSKESVPTDAYVQLSLRLQPVVKSIFFGEPCSTVPLFKRPKSQV